MDNVVIIGILALVLGVVFTDGLRLSPRIVGGVAIRDRCRAPYNSMVALQFDDDFSPVTFCSGVLLTDTFVVTTASCIFSMAGTTDKVATAVVGEKDLVMKREPYEQVISIRSFKVHHRYNHTSKDNNIGLIELSTPAKISRCVKPATRMEEDSTVCDDVDESCQMVGWGAYTDNSATNSRLPRAAAVTVYSELLTSLLSNAMTELPPLGSLYAETANPFQKACYFDWGGVVSCRRNGYNVLRGIIGEQNCNSDPTDPILVVDIPYYQSWLDRCTANWSSCRSATGSK